MQPRLRIAFGFIIPAFLLYTSFVIYPIFIAFWNSLHSFSIALKKTFVGFANYKTLFTDSYYGPRLVGAIWHNVEIIISYYVVGIPLALYFSYMVYRKIAGAELLKTIVFLPYLVSTVIIGFILLVTFDPNIGFLNEMMSKLGLSDYSTSWLGNEKLALLVIMIGSIWKGLGFNFILFLTNMQMISKEVLESAQLEGATGFALFRRIVLPLLAPALTNAIIVACIAGFSSFEMNIAVAQQSVEGNPNYSTDVIGLLYVRTSFGAPLNGYGMGSAIAVIMLIMMLVVSLIQLRLMKKLEWSEG